MSRFGALGLVVVLITSGCSGAGRPTLSEDTAPPLACSSEGMRAPGLDGEGIAPEIATTRQAIIDAAAECDYEALIALGATGPLSVTVDGAATPITTWEQRERDGQPILRFVSGILALRPAAIGADGAATWPSAVDWQFSDVAPADERGALVDVVGEAGVFGWAETGGYAGWRTTIAADGTWASVALGPAPD